MKNRMIKVGNVVPSLNVANISYNTEQIKQAILDHQDCSILLFPELCISGYTCADLFAHDALLEASKNALVEIASIVDQQLIVVGAALKYHNSLYNCAVYISQGKIIGVVPKIYIPTYSEFYLSPPSTKSNISSLSPNTISPPVLALSILSNPSLKEVPGLIIFNIFFNSSSCTVLIYSHLSILKYLSYCFPYSFYSYKI